MVMKVGDEIDGAAIGSIAEVEAAMAAEVVETSMSVASSAVVAATVLVVATGAAAAVAVV